MPLHISGELLLDLRHCVVQGLIVDVGVVCDKVNDFLNILNFEVSSCCSQALSLVKEIVPGLLNGRLVRLPGVDPLLIDGSVGGLLVCDPSLSLSLVVSERDLRQI